MTVELVRPGRAWAVTAVATAAMTVSYLDRQVLAVLAPTITAALSISDETYGWLASAFSLAYLFSAPWAGRWLEAVGVRRGMVMAVALWTLVSAGHALVPGVGALFALRLALGFAEAPSFPGASAAIARTQPPATRARALGILFTGSSLGAMVAPPLATALAGTALGWRGTFAAVALVGLAWVPAWLWITSGIEVRRRLDGDASATPAKAASLRDMLVHPAVRRACVLVLASAPVFAYGLLWGSKLLTDGFGVAPTDVGRYLWVPPLGFDVGAVAFGALAGRHTARTGNDRSPLGPVLVALGMGLGLGLLPLCRTPDAAMAVCGLAMAGAGGLFAMLTAEMIAGVGPALAASAGGFTAAAQSLAYIVANPLIGRSLDRLHDHGTVALAIAAWLVPGALVWLGTRPDATPTDRGSTKIG